MLVSAPIIQTKTKTKIAMLEQSKTVKEIDEAIFQLLEKVPIIKKNSDNDYYRSKYAEYPEIQKAVRPEMIALKLLFKSFPVEGNKLIYILTHIPSQEFYRGTVDLNSISVSPQAQGSAITYMKRYALVAVLDLIIEGDDDDGNSSSNKQQPGATNTQQNQTTPPADLNWLNPNTEDWFKQKGLIFNKGKNIGDIKKLFKINKANSETLVKKEALKPGTKYWDLSVIYLSKKDAKSENITNMFDVSETDLQDLQIDATNYVAPNKEENKTPNKTK